MNPTANPLFFFFFEGVGGGGGGLFNMRISAQTDEHMPYIIQLHIMSIQPANKAAEHLISS